MGSGELENEYRVEEALIRFQAQSEAARMVQQYQQQIREQQERQMQDETGPDCE